MNHFHIQMFGNFVLSTDDAMITDGDNRSKKVWQLLAYILCHRGRQIPRKELIQLLWGDESSSNPENALKTTFHRVRAFLDQLWPSAGHQLIYWQDGGYSWNPKIPVTIDIEEFEQLCRKDMKDETQWIQDAKKALALYRGEFLSNHASEPWVLPITAYYHNLYIQTILDLTPHLKVRGHLQEAAELCREAIRMEPYHEPLHCLLMEILLEMGDLKAVASVYETFRDDLFRELGIRPGEEIKAVYRTVTKSISDQCLPIDTILDYLQETDALAGALQCDFDYFKILCYAESRAMVRSGNATHLALLTVTGGIKELTKKQLETAMELLGEQIRTSLRRGDSFSRCSTSQYIIMLPQANYENSCMVSRRILSAFYKRYPHSPAKLDFVVQPLQHACTTQRLS